MVYGVFVIISSGFWFLNALGETYSTTIEYPVRFTNLPDKQHLVSKLPNRLELKVEAHGFILMRYRVSRSLIPLNINIGEYTLRKIKDRESIYFLPANQTIGAITTQLNDDIRIIQVQPDSILFEFCEIVEKKVQVKPEVTYEIPRQFMVRKIVSTPDSVLITGPKAILDTTRYIPTFNTGFGKINQTTQQTTKLATGELKATPDKVMIGLEIEKFTSSSLVLPVEVIHLPEGYSASLFPEKVNVTFQVALSDFDKVKPYQFRLVADYNSTGHGSAAHHQKMKIQIKKYPSYINSVTISPQFVDYILTRR
jgi:hypothetical protein